MKRKKSIGFQQKRKEKKYLSKNETINHSTQSLKTFSIHW